MGWAALGWSHTQVKFHQQPRQTTAEKQQILTNRKETGIDVISQK
jgi:hypothetical protein